MINNKYNPLKGKKGKSTKSKSTSKSMLSLCLGKNTVISLLYTVVIVVIIVIVVKYIYDKFMKDMKQAHNEPKGVPVSDVVVGGFNLDLVPSGNKVEEGFGNIITNTEAENSYFALSAADQSLLCANRSDLTVGFRNAVSGATFRFQKIDPTSQAQEYFLLGSVNNGKVIQVGEEDDLVLETKSSTETKQHFVRKSHNNNFFFVPKSDESDNQPRALQYEYEHLSLRRTKVNAQPYEGQIFIAMTEAENADLNKQGVSYGLGTAHLDGGDLQIQRPITYVINSGTSGASGASGSQSAAEVVASAADSSSSGDENLNNAVERVLTAFNEYQEQQKNNASGSALGGEPLRVNLNLGGSSKSNFANVGNISNLEAFQNLRGVEGNDVRSLLNAYTKQASANFGDNNLGGISGGSGASATSSLGDTYDDKLRAAAAGTSFRGCPTIDRSKYITVRQASRCYGCAAGEGEK
jgi:hypothetical protein